MKRCRYKPTVAGTVAMVVIATMLLLAGWMEVRADDSELPKTIIILGGRDSSSTTIMDVNTGSITFCTGTDGSLIICQDL